MSHFFIFSSLLFYPVFLRQLSRSPFLSQCFCHGHGFFRLSKTFVFGVIRAYSFFFIDGKNFSQKTFFVPISASFFQILFQLPPPFFLNPLFPKKNKMCESGLETRVHQNVATTAKLGLHDWGSMGAMSNSSETNLVEVSLSFILRSIGHFF